MNNLLKDRIELTPSELDDIGLVYQRAFADKPWFEVSKCVAKDTKNQCESGFSPLKVGEFCTKCALRTAEEAYPLDQLQESLMERLRYPGARLYREYDDNSRLLLAAIFWEDKPSVIGKKKYADVPAMQQWLSDTLPDEPLIWLDEIFADKTLRPMGNLWNFPALVQQVFEGTSCQRLAFRTINEGLLTKSSREIPGAQIFSSDYLPDWRSFVQIERSGDV